MLVVVAVNAQMVPLLGDSANEIGEVLGNLAEDEKSPAYVELGEQLQKPLRTPNRLLIGRDDPALKIQRELIVIIFDIDGEYVNRSRSQFFHKTPKC